MNIKSILLCLILVPFGIMSLISGYRTTKNNSLFQETSKTAMFTPASDGYSEYRKRRSSKVYYTLDEMTYTAETGETVNVKSVTVDADELAKLKAGEGIQCSYLPSTSRTCAANTAKNRARGRISCRDWFRCSLRAASS